MTDEQKARWLEEKKEEERLYQQAESGLLPDGLKRTEEGWCVLVDDTHLSRWIEMHKTLEVAKAEIDWLLQRFSIPLGATVIDAGASLGDHTATYSDLVGPNGRVFSFEPNPLAFRALEENIKLLPNRNVRAFNFALGQDHVPRYIRTMPNAGASYLTSDPTVSAVRTIRLDDLLMEPELTRCDYIHLDVEGCEPEVLVGGWKFFQKFRPAMVIEVNKECLARRNTSEASLRGMLECYNYYIEELLGTPDSPQRDILCLPRSLP